MRNLIGTFLVCAGGVLMLDGMVFSYGDCLPEAAGALGLMMLGIVVQFVGPDMWGR